VAPENRGGDAGVLGAGVKARGLPGLGLNEDKNARLGEGDRKPASDRQNSGTSAMTLS